MSAGDLCYGIQCKYGGRCKNGVCSCPVSCPLTEDPVCASDGVTYQNECALLSVSCNQGLRLIIVHRGECDEDSGSTGIICVIIRSLSGKTLQDVDL